MTTGEQADAAPRDAGGGSRAVPDAENYLDLSGIEDESPGPHFDVVLRGYDRRQVDEHVAGLRRMVAQLRAQLAVRERRREAGADQPAAETAGHAIPSARTPGSGGEPAAHDADGDDTVGAFNDRLRGILQAAEQEAHAVRSRAAETLLAEHAESRAALADLRSQRDSVVDELVRLRGWLDDIVSHPGRTPSAPPPVLTPGPPRGGAPWPPGPPRGRPLQGPRPAGFPPPGPPPGHAGPSGDPGSGGFPAPVAAVDGDRDAAPGAGVDPDIDPDPDTDPGERPAER